MTEKAQANSPSPRVKAVLALSTRVKAIGEIRLIASSFTLFKPVPEVLPFYSTCRISELRPAPHVERHGAVWLVGQRFGLRVHPTEAPDTGEKNQLLEVRATFSLKYEFFETPEVADDVAEGFAAVNARFNLTSYWREVLNSFLARAILPPIAVPPFNATQAIRDLDKPAQAS